MPIEIFVLLLGLVVGSFLNVAIHRLPRDESIVRPRSYCPKCGKAIVWFDNIPLLSFLFLRGHCRDCGGGISFRYPLIELASGLLWWGSWQGTEGSPLFWIRIIFGSLLLVATATDFETGLIPDEITLGGILLGLAVSLFYPELHRSSSRLMSLGKSALGFCVGGGLIYFTGLLGNLIFQKELKQRGLDQSMGGGDVKLLAMAGSFLGWEKVFLAFFTAPFLGLPFALYQRFAKKEATIPYGPFLAMAVALQFFFGEILWRYLLGL